jgi:hypothetical protein
MMSRKLAPGPSALKREMREHASARTAARAQFKTDKLKLCRIGHVANWRVLFMHVGRECLDGAEAKLRVKENRKMRIVTMGSLLLLSVVSAVPASANYFFNSYWGTTLNVGSAPNPTPAQLRAIGDSRWARAQQNNQTRVGSASVAPATAFVAPPTPTVAPITASVVTTSPIAIIGPRPSAKDEKRFTAELNKASLTRATAIVWKAPAPGNKKTAGKSATSVKAATVKSKRPVKAAGLTNAKRKPRV